MGTHAEIKATSGTHDSDFMVHAYLKIVFLFNM